MSDNFTRPSVADTPPDHPLRLGPGKSLSRLFARLSNLRTHSHYHYRHDHTLHAILHELEEIEAILRRLVVPHGAISLATDHAIITTQQAPGPHFVTPSRRGHRL